MPRAGAPGRGLARFRPSPALVCPQVVTGLDCRAHGVSGLCLCERHRHVLDHARMWLDLDGGHVLTGEPYDVAGDELADLCVDVAELG